MKPDINSFPPATRPSGGGASRLTGAGVIIAADHVVKAVDDVDAVAEKYKAFHRLSKRLSFRAPAVLSVDRAAGVLYLERIFYTASLRDLYSEAICRSDHPEMERLLGDAGRILAGLHHDLAWDAEVEWTASATFKARLRQYGYDVDRYPPAHRAILHGDFGYSNIFLGEDGQLVILDPCPNGIVTHACWERAPVYVDIGHMITCLEGAALPLSAMVRLNGRTICRMQRAFLDGYQKGADFLVENDAAFAFGYAIVMEQAGKNRRLKSIIKPSIRYNRFIRKNFPLERKLKFYGRE